MLEVIVSYLVDEWRWPRWLAAWSMAAGTWLLGVGCAVGMTVGSVPLLDGLDDLVSRYMLPIGGLLIAIAAGWLVSPRDSLAGFTHLARTGAGLGVIWRVLIRFVTPIMVTLVLLWQVGAFDVWLKAPPSPPPQGELTDPVDKPAGE